MNKTPEQIFVGDRISYVHANNDYKVDFIVHHIAANYDLSAQVISVELYDHDRCQAVLYPDQGHYVTVEI